jgi:hypothetical protein
MEKRLAFRYGRVLVAVRVLWVAMLGVFSAVAVALFPSIAPAYLALLVGVFGVVFLVLCVSPLLTDHWLTRSRLILRQGWYFRVAIPFAEIASVRPLADPVPGRIPLGIHRPLGRPILFVTAGRTGLIEIRLERPRRFLQALGLLASDIVFDVMDARGFLDAFEERRRLFAPVEAEGPHA